MSKLIALLFGVFLFLWIIIFSIMVIIHISRIIFAKDVILSFSELWKLFMWPLAILNNEGRNQIYTILFKRIKRN